jgi:ribosomal protein S1
MEELLAKSGASLKAFTPGQQIKATLLDINPKMASFDIGGKSEGVLVGLYFDEARDYVKTLKVGDVIDAVVVDPETPDGTVRLSLRQVALDSVWDHLEEVRDNDDEITVMGKASSERGVTVELDSLIGYIPSSQLSKKALENPQKLMGAKFPVRIIELDRSKKRIVLSEKAVTEAEEIRLQEEAFSAVTQGEVYSGVVKQVTNFGAFVEIKVEVDGKKVPIEGLVHISEMAWEKVAAPQDVLKENEKIEVKVIGMKDGKLALSMKQAQKDPWKSVNENYSVDMKVQGIVSRVSNFGVFVELEPGIEGLIHMTKIPPGSDLKLGDKVDCYIEEINASERRISLGLILTAKPVGYK